MSRPDDPGPGDTFLSAAVSCNFDHGPDALCPVCRSGLEAAHELVNGDRQEMYGDPVEHLGNVARAWSGVLGYTITPKQVALCMATLKLVREGYKHDDDNLADAHGYLLIAERVQAVGWKSV